eukprot:s1821_g10.t1
MPFGSKKTSGEGTAFARATMKREPWQGEEAAIFIADLCELPQYAATAQRNFSLIGLRDLKKQGFLSKGLSRAGICDFQHQKRIEGELRSLEQSMSPELLEGQVLSRSASEPSVLLRAQQSLQSHVRKPGPQPKIQRNAFLICHGDMSTKIRSPPLTSTAKAMLRPCCSVGCLAATEHKSRERMSPSPYNLP